MVEPYHPFRKRAASGDDSKDNLCAVCGRSPMDAVHNPNCENFPMTKWTHSGTDDFRPCFCIGPQNGEPLCPCRMRNVHIRDGRYIEILDHGPAPMTEPAQAQDGPAEDTPPRR